MITLDKCHKAIRNIFTCRMRKENEPQAQADLLYSNQIAMYIPDVRRYVAAPLKYKAPSQPMICPAKACIPKRACTVPMTSLFLIWCAYGTGVRTYLAREGTPAAFMANTM